MIHRRLYIPLTAFLLVLLAGCQEQSQPALEQSKEAYSFFALGHAYGHWLHAETTDVIYPPFAEVIDQVSGNDKIDFGVLLGDQVQSPEPEQYDRLDSVLAPFNRPVYIVPGNHDFNWNQWGIPMWGEWDLRYGKRYHAFRYQGDLFFIMDSNSFHWRIIDQQWDLMQRELQNLQGVDNIFFFVHNIIWWDDEPGTTHNYPPVNSTIGRNDSSNFWTEVIPTLEQLDQEVFFFAGDAGAYCSGRELSYFHEKNYHLIAYGMGCRPMNLSLICRVNEDGDVKIHIQPTRHFDRTRGLWLEDYRYF